MSETVPVQLRINEETFENVKRLARKLSFEQDKDVSWQDLIRNVVEEGFPSPILNVLDFAKKVFVGLFPAQKVILKLIYQKSQFNEYIEIDAEDIKIMRSWTHWHGWLKFSNIEQNQIDTIVIAMGRRAGKSLLTAFIAAYEAYKLSQMNNNQNSFSIFTASIRHELSAYISKKIHGMFLISKTMMDKLDVLKINDNLIKIESGKDKPYSVNQKTIFINNSTSNADYFKGHQSSLNIFSPMLHSNRH